MIKPKSVEEILTAAKVEDVVEDFVNLKKRGVNLIGLCPFHSEKTPSFTVSPAKNLYKCFGCGKGGNAVSFVMEHEGLSFPEALRFLAKKYNIELEETDQEPEEDIEYQKRESLLIINEYAAERFRHYLQYTEEGKAIGQAYFRHRGLLNTTIQQFGLGYAPRTGSVFVGEATSRGFNKEYLLELGLMTKNGQDFFRERVVFPFHNLSGKVIGFGARTLSDQTRIAKYLNSAESEIYNKRKVLYGLYQARTEIRREDRCILVEGYTDVLSLSQNDIKNVVSSSGTALTEEQVRLIKRFTQNVTVVYDGDAAGQNAALRGLRIFLENDLNVSLIILPEKEDPDSYVRQLGSKGFREFLQSNSQDFLLYLARQIETEHASNPIQKTQMTRELLENIALLRDHLKRSIYIKECSGLLSISEAQLTREVNKLIRIAINKKNHAKEAVQSGKQAYVDYDPTEDHSQGIRIKLDPQEYQELDILRIIITAGHKLYKPDTKETFADYILVNLEGLEGVIRDIHLKKALKSIRQKEVTGPDYWIYHEDGDIRSMAIDILSENYSYASWSERGYELQTQKMPDENFLRDSFKAVMRFKQKKLQEQIVEFDSLIASEADDLKKLAMLKVSMKLKTDLKEIADHFGSTVI